MGPRLDVCGMSIADVVNLVRRQETEIDSSTLNLYAGTNWVSGVARSVLGSTLCSRVAEGAIGDKYPQVATEYLNEIELVAVEALKYLFDSEYADCRVLSCTLANIAAILAFTSPGDTIMSRPVGTHSTHTRDGFPGYFGLNVEDIPFDITRMNIDVDGMRGRLRHMAVKPKMVFLGGSVMLFPPPVSEVRELVQEFCPDARIVYDAAHVSGLIAGNVFPNPLKEGADLLTSSTYKTFGASAGGFVAYNHQHVHELLSRSIYPTLTTNYHYDRIAALAIVCLDWVHNGEGYARSVVSNARELAYALDQLGFVVIGKGFGYTQTNHVVLDVRALGGSTAANMLAAASILSSPVALPDESPSHPRDRGGLRLGTQEVTKLGMGGPEMTEIATLIADVLMRGRPSESVKGEASRLRRKYDTA